MHIQQLQQPRAIRATARRTNTRQ